MVELELVEVSSRLASSGSSTVPPIEVVVAAKEHFMPTTKKIQKKGLILEMVLSSETS